MTAHLYPVPADVQVENVEEIETTTDRDFDEFEFELITGPQLNRMLRNASASQRAAIADDLRRGRYAIIRHTAQQAKCATRASGTYVAVVHRLPDDKLHSVRRGFSGLAKFAKTLPTDHQADLAIKRLGPDRVMSALDRATAPANDVHA